MEAVAIEISAKLHASPATIADAYSLAHLVAQNLSHICTYLPAVEEVKLCIKPGSKADPVAAL